MLILKETWRSFLTGLRKGMTYLYLCYINTTGVTLKKLNQVATYEIFSLINCFEN